MSYMDVGDLTETERLVWDAFAVGERIDLAARPDRRVRAEVLRALALGARPAEPGCLPALRIAGAVVTGSLRLAYADVSVPITICDSQVGEPILIYGARLRRLTLSGSDLAGVEAQGVVVESGIDLTGAVSTGPITLTGARVDGVLLLDGARLSGGPVALDATHLTVSRSILARKGFECHGEIRLGGAEIAGSVRFDGAFLDNPGEWAIQAQGLRVGAVLDFSGGARVAGGIRLSNAVVASVLTLRGTVLTEPRRGESLDLRNLAAAEAIMQYGAPVPGRVDLRYARIGLLRDDPSSWPVEISLDGFGYEMIAGSARVTDRLRWLRLDPGGYRPQIYARLAAVYRAAGRDDDARVVRLAGERRLRESLPRTGRLWGWLQDLTVGYGYRPRRAGAWLVALLGLGWAVFAAVPPRAAEASKAPEFHAVAYAADLLLPVVDLGQQSAYLPRGWTAWIAYLLIGAGLLFATTAATGIARRLRRD
ncbi:oxidoreductase [Actinoplanes cyaneus]